MIRIGLGGRDIKVFQKQVQRVHVQLGRQILNGAHGHKAALRMVRSTPCARRTDIGGDRRVLLALIGEVKYVWHWRSATAAGPPVLHESDSQASKVPSFLAATLTCAQIEGRHPAKVSSASRSSMTRTGLPPAFFESCAV